VNIEHPWAAGMSSPSNQALACHEFHYSSLQGPAEKGDLAYSVKRGFGVNGESDGIVVKNLLATYCHQRHTENNPWITHFFNFIQSRQTN
jgi:cobyrinic acid a,c-diamide synthase